jgi:S-adenosylmethionine:tRNA ribosyltransferase-isomerase
VSSIQDFDYNVDPERIALAPAEPRSSAKLMVVSRETGEVSHSKFSSLPVFLRAGDLLIFNSSEVLRARFLAKKQNGKQIEGIFISAIGHQISVWLKGKVKAGESIYFEDLPPVKVISRAERDAVLDILPAHFLAWLKNFGQVPLPPYIRKERERKKFNEKLVQDQQAYSTVFAEAGRSGSIAAPTASLHFDEMLLSQIKTAGVEIGFIKLHVGLGTFEPVDVDQLDQHQMHREMVEVPLETQTRIAQVRANGGRVIAVGTTVMRSLESAVLSPSWGKAELVYETDLFIRPPYIFRTVDGLVTNFHWPRSTLLVLIATFLEAQRGSCPAHLQHRWREAYAAAFTQDYKLFSYGDGMLIL